MGDSNETLFNSKEVDKLKGSSIIPSMLLFPVAGKSIEDLNNFMRELLFMQTVKSEFLPKYINADLEK